MAAQESTKAAALFGAVQRRGERQVPEISLDADQQAVSGA